MIENLMSATAAIAFYFGLQKCKIGNEGVMKHFDLLQQIAKAFCEKYPDDYDWEKHRENGGDDWDIECENFAQDYIDHKIMYVDRIYFKD